MANDHFIDGVDKNGNTVANFGSSYNIGDGVSLTAGHIVFEFNEQNTPSSRTILTRSGLAIYQDLRGYKAAYATAAASLSNPLPPPSQPGVTVSMDVEAGLTDKDFVVVSEGGSVTNADEGLATFLSPGDLVTGSPVFLAGATYRRYGKTTGPTSGDIVSLRPNGGFNFSSASQGGDSGGGYVLSYGGHKYVFGVQSAQNYSTGYAIGTYLTKSEWDSINAALEASQFRNVTSSEPSNLVVGSIAGDTFSGSYRADRLLGRDGNDIISDGESVGSIAWGDDTLIGGSGNDTLTGTFGNDVFWGDDEGIDASNDLDKVDYSSSSKSISINYDSTTSTPSLSVSDGFGTTDTLHSIEEIKGTTSRDIVRVNGTIVAGTILKIDGNGGQAGSDIVNFNGSTSISGIDVNIDAAGNGYIRDKSNPSAKIDLVNFHTRMIASGYDDNIVDSSSGSKSLSGGAGNDVISIAGATSDSTLFGGVGDDTLTGGSGNDLIFADDGYIRSSEKNYVYGGDGSDLIVNSTGASQLFGQNGNDYFRLVNSFGNGLPNSSSRLSLTGGAGNDVVQTFGMGPGSVNFDYHFSANDGHDTFIIPGTSSTSNFSLNLDLDGISKSDLTFLWNAPLDGNSHTADLAIIVNSTDASIFIPNVYGYVGQYQELTQNYLSIQINGIPMDTRDGYHVVFGDPSSYNRGLSDYQADTAGSLQQNGSSGNDELLGSGGNNQIAAGAGDDIIDASYGNDTIDGGSGNDIYSLMGSRSDYQVTSSGSTITVTDIAGIEGTATLTSIESVYFSTTDDNYSIPELIGYFGSADADTISGSFRDSTISGLDGNDLLDGGAGSDLIYGGNGNDTLIGGQGYDTLFGDAGTDVARFGGSIANYRSWRNADGSISVDHLNGGSDSLDTLNGIETLEFSDGSYNVSTLPNSGTAGADTINGTSHPDYLFGLDGNDSLVGNDGDDALDGGAGADTMVGGNGADTYFVDNTGDLVLEAVGGPGDIVQSSVDFVLPSQVEDLWLDYESSAISGTGNALNNDISGNEQNNLISGLGGDDTLYGDSGDDIFLVGGTADGFDDFDGSDGNDTIKATAANTVIGISAIHDVETVTSNGNAGVSILGSSGDNILDFSTVTLTGITSIDGGAGNDVIVGTSGADTLQGSAGDDTLSGANGNDTFRYSGSSNGFDSVSGGSGTDTILATTAATVIGLSGITGIETVNANSFANVSIAGSGSADTLNFSAMTLTGIVKIDAGAGNDSLVGSSAADTIIGGDGDDTLSGGGGNDTFQYAGASGYDSLDGGSGTDTILGTSDGSVIGLKAIAGVEAISANGFAAVYIQGSGAADVLGFASTTLTGITKIDAGSGDDSIMGSSAADSILGGDGLDTLSGGSGADTISGDAGNDVIIGGAANDSLAGGDGDDVFKVGGTADGLDIFDGGLGNDTIQATATNTSIGITSISAIEYISSGGFSGVSLLGTTAADLLNFSSVTMTGITKIDGGSGNDTITGSGAADTILGSGGDDTIVAGSGNDVIQYTGTSNGFDSVDGGLGTDTISALANSTVIGLASITGVETISAGTFTGVYVLGSANADTLNFSATTLTAITKIDGGTGNDTITGSTGADTILGSGGDDAINAGNGNDSIQFTGTANGFDAIDGGAGTDMISALANSTVIGLSSLTGVETISGGAFTGVYISGSGNADTLNFSSVTLTAITKIQGGTGADIITGSTANDTILGGTENDTLNGGAGNDSLTGDDGDDLLIGGAGNDTINGGNGTDTVDYSYATANLTVSLALTTAQTVATGDVDTITNIENLIGGSGADTITGSTGNNVLSGGDGNDRITGGAGNDTINGGAGTLDVAVFAGLQASYTITTVSGTTTIVDNQATTDGNDGTDTLVGVEKAEFKGGVQVALAPPIVLDLDGDGVELVDRKNSKAKFDWDGDGKRDNTGWVGKDDGLLVFDRNGDGKVSGANELSFVDDKPGAKSDLDGLSAFDSNDDGVFSAADDKFAAFRVWRDKDGDGKEDKGELLTLAQAGVASINLSGDAVNKSWGWNDNLTINTGSFTRTDGTGGALGDVALNYKGTSKTSSNGVFVAASRFAEALAAFQPQATDDLSEGQHNQQWERQPLFSIDRRASL